MRLVTEPGKRINEQSETFNKDTHTHTYTHTQDTWNITQPIKKEWNSAICNNIVALQQLGAQRRYPMPKVRSNSCALLEQP